jgi:hypothetical protein
MPTNLSEWGRVNNLMIGSNESLVFSTIPIEVQRSTNFALQRQHDLYVFRVKMLFESRASDLIQHCYKSSSSDEVKERLRLRFDECEVTRSAKLHLYQGIKQTSEEEYQLTNVYNAFYRAFNHLKDHCLSLSGEKYEARVAMFYESVNDLFADLHGYVTSQLTSAPDAETMSDTAAMLIDSLLNSNDKFWEHWPMYYNPVSDTVEKVYPLKAIVVDNVTCAISLALVNRRNAYPVHGGTYISKRVYDTRDDLRDEFVFCQLESNGILYKATDCVPVYTHTNSHHLYNVFFPHATKKYQYDARLNRFYSFDIRKYCCYLVGKEWLTRSQIDEYGDTIQYEESIDAWVFKEHKFRLFPYCDDVLNYYSDAFKTAPYEDCVRGDKDPTKNTLFMGLELEVEMSKKATVSLPVASSRTFNELKGHAIVMSDGSLDDGFEIVSVPMTLGYHYKVWEKFLRSDLRKQIVSYMRATCGIHIHMSKECFSSLSLGKFCTFINSKENQPFIERIAQRGANKYNERPPTKVSNGKSRGVYIDEHGKRHGKYTSVNLTKPNTVEVRIFKGTLAYPQVMKNFEFLHALHKYVTFYASNKTLSYKDFVSWLSDPLLGNRRMYPFLFDYLTITKDIVTKHEIASTATKEDLTDSLAESGTQGFEKISRVSEEKLQAVRMAAASRSHDSLSLIKKGSNVKCA